MIIDIHGYVVAPPQLYSTRAYMLGERGWQTGTQLPPAEVVEEFAKKSIAMLDEVGTDVQFIGPRPYHLMHAEKPAALVHRWIRMYNDVIAMQCAAHPDRLRGWAGLPQIAGESPKTTFEELDRCINDLGFMGVMLNPDPGEGDNLTPGLGEEYWYPLFEKLEHMDVPALVVSGSCRATREGYSSHYITESSIAALSIISNPQVFRSFPKLKLIISYGGGSIPYQAGRWRVRNWRVKGLEDFDTAIRRLYFDTVIHTRSAMEMLFEVCGPERCLFGTQRPGAGSANDPATGKPVDDLRPLVEKSSLNPSQRRLVFEENARQVFSRFRPVGQ